jgi:hypothetical protein
MNSTSDDSDGHENREKYEIGKLDILSSTGTDNGDFHYDNNQSRITTLHYDFFYQSI